MGKKNLNILIVSNIQEECPAVLNALAYQFFLKNNDIFQLNLYCENPPPEELVKLKKVPSILLQANTKEICVEAIRNKIEADLVFLFPGKAPTLCLLQFYLGLKKIYAAKSFIGIYSEEILFFEKEAFMPLEEKLKIVYALTLLEKIIDQALIQITFPTSSLTPILKSKAIFLSSLDWNVIINKIVRLDKINRTKKEKKLVVPFFNCYIEMQKKDSNTYLFYIKSEKLEVILEFFFIKKDSIENIEDLWNFGKKAAKKILKEWKKVFSFDFSFKLMAKEGKNCVEQVIIYYVILKLRKKYNSKITIYYELFNHFRSYHFIHSQWWENQGQLVENTCDLSFKKTSALCVDYIITSQVLESIQAQIFYGNSKVLFKLQEQKYFILSDYLGDVKKNFSLFLNSIKIKKIQLLENSFREKKEDVFKNCLKYLKQKKIQEKSFHVDYKNFLEDTVYFYNTFLIYTALGVFYFKKEKIEKAESYFLKASICSQNTLQALVNLAATYKIRDYEKFKKIVEQMKKRFLHQINDEDEGKVALFLAEFSAAEGNILDAWYYLYRAILKNPDHIAIFTLKNLLLQLSRKSFSNRFFVEQKEKPFSFELKKRLNKAGWSEKEKLYQAVFEKRIDFFPKNQKVYLSIIVVIHQWHGKLFSCLEQIQKNMTTQCELIVVLNGASIEVIEKALPFISQVIVLKDNTYASMGRNFGSLFAKGSYLLFIDDDALVHPSCIRTHLKFLKLYQPVSLRGVCFPDRATPCSGVDSQTHNFKYFFSVMATNIEGNTAYLKKLFLSVKGFEESIMYGYEGYELTHRLMQIEGDTTKYLGTKEAIIYHDFGVDELDLKKREKKINTHLYQVYILTGLSHSLKKSWFKWQTIIEKQKDITLFSLGFLKKKWKEKIKKQMEGGEALFYTYILISLHPLSFFTRLELYSLWEKNQLCQETFLDVYKYFSSLNCQVALRENELKKFFTIQEKCLDHQANTGFFSPYNVYL